MSAPGESLAGALALLLVASVASAAPPPTLKGRAAPARTAVRADGMQVFLVAAGPVKGVKGAVKVGCDDTLVPVKIPVQCASNAKADRLEATLNRLFSLTSAELSRLGARSAVSGQQLRASVGQKEDMLKVNITGTPSFGGACDVPRFKEQVERTVAQFGPVTILLNGSAPAWRCLGDASGKCPPEGAR